MSLEAHKSALPASPSQSPNPMSHFPGLFRPLIPPPGTPDLTPAPVFPRNAALAELPSARWLETFHASQMLLRPMHSFILSDTQSTPSAHHMLGTV